MTLVGRDIAPDPFLEKGFECSTIKSISNVSWVNTNEQLADCLTKEGASPHKLLDVMKSNVMYK